MTKHESMYFMDSALGKLPADLLEGLRPEHLDEFLLERT